MFTDGACRGNPGPGGWAVLLRMGNREKELSGGEPLTTNNRMELMAAIRGLEALNKACRVRLHTDSIYVRDGITRWVHNWQERRAVAGADRRLGAAPHRMALGQGPQRPSGERPRRRARLRRGRRPAPTSSPVN